MAPPELNEFEIRVLGCLLEKSRTIPDYYPLSLNSLTIACNQKNCRQPVVEYDGKTVLKTLDSLRMKKLVMEISQGGARVLKYEHRCRETWALPDSMLAILCLLMLRGPQTAAEIRSRSDRIHSFDSTEQVEELLAAMSEDAGNAWVFKMPRMIGIRECRYTHLFAGKPDVDPESPCNKPDDPVRRGIDADNERFESLEQQVRQLRQDLAELRQDFLDFKRLLE